MNIKRIIIIILAMLWIALPAIAINFSLGSLNYQVNSDGSSCTVIGYSGRPTTISIPPTVTYQSKEYSVTDIGPQSFYNYSSLISITIPNTITNIGDLAFYNCRGLSNITIEDGVKAIGDYAFYGCSDLSLIYIPNSIISIGNNSFAECTKLSSVSIGNSVSIIGNWCFYNCAKLNSIEIPNSVLQIGNLAFSECKNLSSVSLGNSIKSIGAYAFYNCAKISSINIPNSVISIGNSAFENCYLLKELSLSNSILKISESLFAGCCNLMSVAIPISVSEIESSAFKGCVNLAFVSLGNSIGTIGSQAFYGCSKLSEISIPSSVTTINDGAFCNCESLSSIIFEDGEQELYLGYGVKENGWSMFSGCAISYVYIGRNLIGIEEYYYAPFYNSSIKKTIISSYVNKIPQYTFYNCKSLTMAELPNSLEYLGHYAFYGCSSLTSITLPGSVKEINYSAFEGCSSLNVVEIGNGVIDIGDAAFKGCSSLTMIELPNSLMTIGNSAFDDCLSLNSLIFPDSITTIGDFSFRGCTSINSINFPASVTSIGRSAFYGCGLNNIYSNAITPPNCFDSSFWELYTTCRLYVPHISLNAYKNAAGWKNFANLEAIIVKATDIILDKSNYTMHVGEVLQLNAKVMPENVSIKSLNWMSTNPNVATVDDSGLVTAISEGTSQIIATTTDGTNLYAICDIAVENRFVEIDKIQISPSNARIPVGKSVKLNTIITPNDASSTNILWYSNNTSVATVSQDGNVDAIAEGEAIIIASPQDGSNLYATCSISVYNEIVFVSEIILNPKAIEGEENESVTINVVVNPENATNKQISWYSSNDNVAIVSDGVVNLVNKGTAIITAEAVDGSNVKSECCVVVSDSARLESIIEDKNTDVKIFNLNGHLIYQGIYSEANIEPGIYIVLCNGKSFKAKID